MDTDSLEWKLIVLKREIDMLGHALYLNREAPLHRLVKATRKGCTGQ